MKIQCRSPRPALLALICGLSLPAAALPVFAQAVNSVVPATAASLTGRVYNQATARYVNNARVAVLGTTLQTFTDETGAYGLDGITPGPVTIVVSFTNTAAVTQTLTLAPG
jgi:type II secretory pathway pseudopilin PulG